MSIAAAISASVMKHLGKANVIKYRDMKRDKRDKNL